MRKFLAKLVFLMYAFICFSANLQTEGYSFDFSSTFHLEKDETAPFNWTLGIPSLNISIASKADLHSPGIQLIKVLLYPTNSKTLSATILLYEDGSFERYKFSPNTLNISHISWDMHNFSAIALLPKMTEEYNSSTFRVEVSGSTGTNATIYLQECQDTVSGTYDKISVTPDGGASYEDYGDCSCSVPDSELYHKDGRKFVGKAQCNAVTKWNGCQEAECWYAPLVSGVDQNHMFAGFSAELYCSYTDGFPEETEGSFFINDKKVDKPVTLTSSHHLQKYYCKATNKYTIASGKEAASPNKTLIVYFKPEDLTETSGINEIQILINETMRVNFSFRANDADDNVTTTFHQLDGSEVLTPVSNTFDSMTAYHYISYNINVNNESDYGKYIFIASTSRPQGLLNTTIKVVDYPVTTTPITTTSGGDNGNNSDPHNNTLAIAVGCGAVGIALIIVLVVALIIYRRRKGKGVTEKNKAKEEKVDPLYQETQIYENMVENTYATIDQ